MQVLQPGTTFFPASNCVHRMSQIGVHLQMLILLEICFYYFGCKLTNSDFCISVLFFPIFSLARLISSVHIIYVVCFVTALSIFFRCLTSIQLSYLASFSSTEFCSRLNQEKDMKISVDHFFRH